MSQSFIHKTAKVGQGSIYGDGCHVSANAVIGSNCRIGHNVIIHEDTVIGDNVRIDDGAIIGKMPMRSVNSAITKDEQLPAAQIGNGCLIGSHCVIYRGCNLDEEILVADLATVRENVTIGAKTIVGRGVAIENFCTIGKFCKLETNAYITAHSVLGDRVFVSPCVATSNDNYAGRSEERKKHYKGVTVEKGGRIGVHATILPGKVIHEDGLVAAGALLTKDCPAKEVVAGIPAKHKGPVPDDQLLENQGWEE